MSAKVTVRKTGAPRYPWEARCSACQERRTHFVDGIGAVAINSRGIGNRLWVLAMLAACAHLQEHALCTGTAECLATDAHMLCCPAQSPPDDLDDRRLCDPETP